MTIDSHCHLDDDCFALDRDAVIGRAREAGVGALMTIGTGDGPPDLEAATRLADRYDCVWATAGVHPHDAAKATGDSFKRIEQLMRHPKVLALGEIGLDYHYDNSPRDTQRAVFASQLAIALEAGKPVVIHTREAWDDTFEILERHWISEAGGVMHCFSGGPEEAARCLALGFHLSFAGIVTYPKAVNVHEAARMTPPDRLLVETDAPYLAPIPHRGKRNEPAFVVHTARRLAELREEAPEAISGATARNFATLFRLDGLP